MWYFWTSDWEQRKLIQLAQFNPKASLPNKFEYVDLESVVGTEMISHRTETNESAPSRAQRLAIQGDVFYQTVRPYQKNNYLFDLPHNNYVFSTGYAQLRPFGDSYFLLSRVQEDKFVFNVLDRSTGTSYPAINSNDLAQIEVSVPPVVEEQTKIGTFFKHLDNTIALHQRKISLFKRQKQTYLQLMLPQKNEDRPIFRFSFYSNSWEIRRFKDFVSKSGNKNTEGHAFPAYSVSNKLGLVKQSDQFDGSRLDDLDKADYKMVKPEEFAYNPARINVGSLAFNNLEETVLVSSLYVVVKMSKQLDNEYVLQFLKSNRFIKEVKRNTEGSVREYLFFENFKNIKFPYTSNVKEQKLISSFFKKLDNTIDLHQNKLEKLLEFKQILLGKMFL